MRTTVMTEQATVTVETPSNVNERISTRPPSYHTAVKRGEVTHRSGWHNPAGRSFTIGHHRGCGCDTVTRNGDGKGAYRDETVELPDGVVIHFYHQNAVAVEFPDGKIRLSSKGWKTRTTKQRINRYLPVGFGVIQRDFDWYLTHPDGDRTAFEDGMVIRK